MRKYLKLLLVSVAIVCFCLMIFYKHQYDRMFDAFQVLDTFGEPAGSLFTGNSGGGGKSDNIDRVLAAAATAVFSDQPLTVWRRVSNLKLFVFSALTTAPHQVTALAVSADLPDSASQPDYASLLSCWLWSDSSGSVSDARVGRVSVQPLPSVPSSTFSSWLVNCTVISSGGGNVSDLARVYMLGLASRQELGATETGGGLRPTLIPVAADTSARHDGRRTTDGSAGDTSASGGGAGNYATLGVCVPPADNAWQSVEPARLAEFAAFHSSAGTTWLWLYEPLPAPFLRRLLRRWAAVGGQVNIRPVAWQFPLHVTTPADRLHARHVLTRDCLARAAGHVAHVVVLNVSQYVVPRAVTPIHAVYSLMAEQLRQPHIDAFSLTQQIMCTDAADGPYSGHPPYLLINTKTSHLPAKALHNAVWIVRVPAAERALSSPAAASDARALTVRSVNPTVMAVHLYSECAAIMPRGWQNATASETAAVRHKTRVVHSPLYQTYRQLRDQTLVAAAT